MSTRRLLNPFDQTIDFGMHKGKPLDEVPTDYLLWVLQSVKLSWDSREQLMKELRRRGISFPEAKLKLRKL
jgi:hypothetical protein